VNIVGSGIAVIAVERRVYYIGLERGLAVAVIVSTVQGCKIVISIF
jgi:hypothetical protein